MMMMTDAQLIGEAVLAREKAYAPYSHFKVGAAILTQSGAVYTGCNIENASYSLTLCAERTALCKAVSAGDTAVVTLAVVGAKTGAITSPCGACRQMLYEFGGKTLRVLMAKSENEYQETTLDALLPFAFGPKNL